jgi:biopolymer transport protein ExbD
VIRVWPQPKRKYARIEIIPMIDVMMFLLVFYVLISINVLPALGLKVALPHSA